MRILADAELTQSLDAPIDPALPWEEWPVRPGWPADGRGGDPAFYRVMLPCCDRPYGVHLGHTWHEAGLLLRMIELAGVRRFVELGVHAGGLAALLIGRSLFDGQFSYLGVELDAGLVSAQVKAVLSAMDSRNAGIIYGNCFSEPVKSFVAEFAYRDEGRVLFYCDDGDKPAELRAYASMPRRGDILATHDHFEGQIVRDLPEFGPLEQGGRPFPGPEVLTADVAFLADAGFERMPPTVWTPESRIIAFVRK